jgi:hypothetical protein
MGYSKRFQTLKLAARWLYRVPRRELCFTYFAALGFNIFWLQSRVPLPDVTLPNISFPSWL